MKRLVLLVEADGDVQAVPSLVARLLAQLPEELQGQLFLDNAPMKVGGLHQITGRRQGDLVRHLGNAAKRSKLGAALLILDGDADRFEGQPFCAVEVARTIAQRAAAAGAGTRFSFAVVFLRQEYESLLLAVADQLPGLKPGATLPSSPEEHPRDAKGWLHEHLADGHNPTDRQLELTRAVKDWTPVGSLSCFQRLGHALEELADAVATSRSIVSPQRPKS
jgi:hypothetical protein